MRKPLCGRRGTVEDRETVLGMIDEAAAWLGTIGTDQWATPWPSREQRDQRVVNGLRAGDTLMVEEDGRAVATITYRREGNDQLWTSEELREPAVYVSRLVVRRSYARCGIGSSLLDWAGYRGRQDWGARWIRVDVWTTNEALHKYYKKCGFSHVRTCPYDLQTYPSSALFQRPTDDTGEAAGTRFTLDY